MRALRIVLIVLLIPLVAAFVILEWPGLVFRPALLRSLLPFVPQVVSGLSVSAGEIRTRTESHSFFQKQVFIAGERVCVNYRSGLRFCARLAEFALRYDFGSIPPKLVQLGPLRVEHGEVEADLRDPYRAADARSVVPTELKIPNWLAESLVGPVSVRLSKIEVLQDSRESRGSLFATGNGRKLEVTLAAASGGTEFSSRLQLTGSGRIKGPWSFQSSHELASKRFSTRGETSGTVGENGLAGSLRETARLSSPGVPEAGVTNCEYGYRPEGEVARIRIRCPGYLEVPGAARLARRWFADFDADLTTAFPPSADAPIRGELSVRPRSPAPSLIRVDGGARIPIDLVPAEVLDSGKLAGTFELRGSIPAFEKWVKTFSKTPFAIPAPLHALRGSAEFAANGNFVARTSQGSPRASTRFHLDFGTALASRKRQQRLKIQGTTDVSADAAPNQLHLRSKTDLALTEVRLTLPELTLGIPPQLLPDPRLASDGNLIRKLDVDTRIHLETPPGKPVLISTSFTKEATPIHLDLTLVSPKRVFGDILITQQGLEEVAIHVDADFKEKLAAGEMVVVTRDSSAPEQDAERTTIPAQQLAGQAAGEAAFVRAAPKLPVPAVKILSSLLVGLPLHELTSSPQLDSSAPSEETSRRRGGEFIQLRKRY